MCGLDSRLSSTRTLSTDPEFGVMSGSRFQHEYKLLIVFNSQYYYSNCDLSRESFNVLLITSLSNHYTKHSKYCIINPFLRRFWTKHFNNKIVRIILK